MDPACNPLPENRTIGWKSCSGTAGSTTFELTGGTARGHAILSGRPLSEEAHADFGVRNIGWHHDRIRPFFGGRMRFFS